MNILALDLGTQLGWARMSRGQQRSGSISFAPRSKDGPGQRWLKFRAFLSEQRTEVEFSAIYYEQPILFVGNGPATVLMFGGFEAILQSWAEVNRVPLVKVNVSTIKKHWTGKGNAKKPDMIRIAKERGWSPKDDNEADAIALLDYGMCDQGAPTKTAIELGTVASLRGLIPADHPAWADPLVPA